MKLRRIFSRYFVEITHKWNSELHSAIENKVISEYFKTFPNEAQDPEKAGEQVDKMREFYYARMMNTAALLVTFASIIISLVALVVAIAAIFYSKP
jgi:hypothetical protein